MITLMLVTVSPNLDIPLHANTLVNLTAMLIMQDCDDPPASNEADEVFDTPTPSITLSPPKELKCKCHDM